MPLTDITGFVAELDHCISYVLLSAFIILLCIFTFTHILQLISAHRGRIC